MEKELGKKIKQLRTEQGLTMRELADKANLSVGYISLVERGLTSISLTSLKNIAEALGVDSNDFFHAPKRKAERVVRGYDLTVLRLTDSHYVYHSLSGGIPKDEQKMEPVLVTLLPGQKTKNVLPYSHEGEEFAYVLEGTLTVLLESKSYDLNPGDSFHLPSKTPHNWANFTNNLVKLVCVNTVRVFE